MMEWLLEWFRYIDIPVVFISAFLIGYAIHMQIQIRKIHKVNATLALMELSHEGNLLWWRNRALVAERELRQLKGD